MALFGLIGNRKKDLESRIKREEELIKKYEGLVCIHDETKRKLGIESEDANLIQVIQVGKNRRFVLSNPGREEYEVFQRHTQLRSEKHGNILRDANVTYGIHPEGGIFAYIQFERELSSKEKDIIDQYFNSRWRLGEYKSNGERKEFWILYQSIRQSENARYLDPKLIISPSEFEKLLNGENKQ